MIAWVLGLSLIAQAQGLQGDARVVLAIGNNIGAKGEEPLDYAEEDARRFHQLMTELGGVSAERAYLVLGANARTVRQKLNEARGRVQELAARQRTSLIVFVSAHADQAGIHLSGTTLPLQELHQLVRTSAADLKLTVVDACQTAVRSRQKGGRPVPEVALSYGPKSKIDGDVLITSASAGEPAQERAFLRGALFSHHLMTGLRGAADVDRDLSVSLTEAYAYAYRKTAAQAVMGGAAQHPSFSFDTRGFGAWILTRPGNHQAALVLEEGIEGKVWVANRKRELVAEVTKASSERLRLAVPAGWYRIVRPDGAYADVADVNLGWGGVREVRAEDFVRTRMSASKLKGRAPIVLRPWQAGIGYSLGLNPLPGGALEHAGHLQLMRHFGQWQLRSAFFGTTSDFRTPNSQVRNWHAGLGLGAAYTVPVGWLTLGFGLDLNISWIRQVIDRDDEALIEMILGVQTPDRVGWMVGAVALAFIAVPIGDRFAVRAELAAGGARVPFAESPAELSPLARGSIAVAWSF